MDNKYAKDGKRLMELIRKVIAESPEIDAMCREAAEPEGLCVLIDVSVEIGIPIEGYGETPELKAEEVHADATGSTPPWEPTVRDMQFMKALRIVV